ncbi:MAG: DNRLRE domain-containing protein [candidate division KSB1 bacterium]|jgi:hypothetical protein|nr:DNRLRE domain-containing protein [candidate division KSB1 bacterium]
MRYSWAAPGLVLLALTVGCSKNEKLPYGLGLVDRIDTGSVKVVEIAPPVAEASYERGRVTTGKSPYLLAGEADGYRAAIVIRFSALPDSSVVDGATLWLSPASYRGIPAPLALSAQQVTAAWSEDSVTWANFTGDGGPQVGWASMLAGDSVRVGIPIEPWLVGGWIDSSLANYGLYITVSGPALQEFHSSQATDTTRYPRLEISYMRKGGADTALLKPSADAFLVTYAGSLPPGRLLIANATGWRVLVKFALDSIPSDATINRARLELWIDQSLTKLRDTGMAIAGRPIVSEPWNPPDLAVDTTMSVPVAVIVKASEKLTFSVSSEIADFTAIVQAWTSGRLPNRGLMLYSTGEGLDASEAVLFSSGAGEGTMPRLLVEYTVPPRP